MKSKIIFIILFISFAMTMCSKDRGCGNTIRYENIPQTYLKNVPYVGGEILTFLHVNTGDTVRFNGEPNWTGYSNSTFDKSDCHFETKHQGRGIAYVHADKKIVINQRNTNNYVATFEVDFENEYFITGDFSDNRIFDYDSIIIANRLYYNVFRFNIDASFPPTNYFIYCNSKYGILKFELASGETWELINNK